LRATEGRIAAEVQALWEKAKLLKMLKTAAAAQV